jgi:hypothetical protein
MNISKKRQAKKETDKWLKDGKIKKMENYFPTIIKVPKQTKQEREKELLKEIEEQRKEDYPFVYTYI